MKEKASRNPQRQWVATCGKSAERGQARWPSERRRPVQTWLQTSDCPVEKMEQEPHPMLQVLLTQWFHWGRTREQWRGISLLSLWDCRAVAACSVEKDYCLKLCSWEEQEYGRTFTSESVTFTCCSPRMRQRSRRQLRAHIGSSEEEAKCSGKVLLPAVAHSRPYQQRLTLGLVGLKLSSWGDRCLGQLLLTTVESENSEASWSTGYS